MGDRKKKQNGNVGFDESSEAIMEETLKGIFDEVKEIDEEEGTIEENTTVFKAQETSEEEASNLPESPASGNEIDISAAADKAEAPEKEIKAEKVKKKKKKLKKKKMEEEMLNIEDGEDLTETEEDFPILDAGEAEELEPELDAEDGEDFDDDIFDEEEEKMTEEEKAERRRKRRKALKITAASFVGVIAVIYFGFSVFFMSHFYFNTKINGVNFSMKSADAVEKHMEQQVKEYVLTLEESDGGNETISGADISLVYEESGELKNLLKEQNAFLWPSALWKKPEITASVGVSYDKEKLSSLIAALDCMKEENQEPPASAKPEFDGNEFVVKAEEVGSQVDAEALENKVNEYIAGFRDTLDMAEESCYLKPQYTEDSPEVEAACAAMNEYLTASITYTFGSATEVVDKALISQWLTTDENLAVTFNTDAVSQYIYELATKYNTYQKQRTFTSGSGNTVTVEGGDYGWIIDEDAEYQALVASIQAGEVTTREPAYSQTAASHDAADWGNTYVEVDLTNQYMYLFVNGSVVTSAPIVTGKPSAGDATPQGVYYIKYCQRNATLRGPKQSDGSYEWESPVAFWMPFNGGIGLHDASWQAAFGGDRYLTHGSHGCVNLQYSVAETVYNNVQAGTPVVCHY